MKKLAKKSIRKRNPDSKRAVTLIEDLIGERLLIETKNSIFSGILKFSENKNKNFFMNIGVPGTYEGHGHISFTPSEVKQFFEEEGYWRIILKS